MTYQEWLQGPGFGAKSEADPYGLGDYGNGSVIGNSGLYKYNDESQADFLQRFYGAATDPSSGFGTAGRSFADMQNAGLYNTLGSVDINGQSMNRIGENLNQTVGQQEGDIQDYFNQRGGPGASYDPTYGWVMPTAKYADMQKLQDYNHRKMAGINDWAPTLFGMAATAGVGALGGGAAVAAEGGAAGGSAGGGAGAFEGAAASGAGGYGGASEALVGQLARQGVSTAGNYMSGGNPTNGLIGMAGTAAGGFDTGGADTSWGVNPRESGMDWTDAADNIYDPGSIDYSGIDTGGGDPFAGATAGAEGSTDWGSMLGGGASVLSKLFGGGSNSGSALARILGQGASSYLGYNAAQNQTNALRDMQSQYFGMGQPYRDRLNASYQPGFSMSQDPAYAGAMDASANAVARSQSAKGGNPFDNPGMAMEAQKYVMNNTALPAMQNYRSQLGTFGQFGSAQAGQLGQDAIQSRANGTNAITGGINNLTQPQFDMNSLMQMYGQQQKPYTLNYTGSAG